MTGLLPFRLGALFRRRRPRFEAAVRDEIAYLTGAFGEQALTRGRQRAEREHISPRRREVILEAVRRIGEAPPPSFPPSSGETGP